MANTLVIPWSTELSLGEALDRIEGNAEVVAVGFLGSTGTDRWTESSDYDLLLVMKDYPAGFGIEATFVDHRITDVVVADRGRAASLGGPQDKPEPGSVADAHWAYVAWLAQARWIQDRHGIGTVLQRRAAALLVDRPAPAGPPSDVFRSFLTHDVRANVLLLHRTDDPITRLALGMRQLHTFVAAVSAWFTLRGLPNEGWKKNLAVLADQEPDTFALIQQWLDSPDLHVRHDLFTQVVDRALAPVGGRLPDTAVFADSNEVWQLLTQ
ncbi:MAG: hypothetical protein LCH87_08085 [Actinobacteria bacterium]|nr:hypothetical protein [Actinomycetota bacterium]